MVRRDHRDARRLEAHLKVFRRGRGELTQVEERRPRGADDDPGGPGLELRQGSFADVAGEAYVVAIDLRQPW
jgi:hypothetical protein